jgi:hypothetical protein
MHVNAGAIDTPHMTDMRDVNAGTAAHWHI